MIYIYTLSHPITNEVRYVGKTINLKRRYKQHLYDKRHSYKASWVKSLKKDNLKPLMKVLEICKNNWQEREIFWISQFDNLTNLKQGGGVDFIRTTSEETRQKLRDANLGKTLTEEHKNKIRLKMFKKSISIDGIIYESYSQASRMLEIGVTTIIRRVKSKNFPNYLYM